ncbi:MAG: hypothetical protein RL660_1869 [Bacteroidota bacterium]
MLSSLLFVQNAYAQIAGSVFKDYNGDGQWQVGIEPPAAGIIIDSYDSTNTLVASTVSAANGTYSLPFTVPVRVEYIIGDGICLDSTYYFKVVEPLGNNVRFISGSTNNLNFGINNPSEFTLQSDPLIFVTKLNKGDPLNLVNNNNSSASNTVAFISYPFSTSAGNGFVPPYTAKSKELGCVWGVAYNKKAKKIFTCAFLKRTSGLGPMGSGGIYKLDTTAAGSFSVSQFYNMDANGHRTRAASTAIAYGNGTSFNLNNTHTQATFLGPIDTLTGEPEGLGVIGDNGQRGMTPQTTGAVYDPAGFDQVGKVGLGDMDFSDDGKFLFVMNLYSRKVFRLEMDNAFDPQNVVSVTSYDLPAITVSNGKLRAFAVTYHNSRLYVGAVSTGESGGGVVVGGSTDVYAYVLELRDPTGNAYWSPNPYFSMPLNYKKGFATGGTAGTDQWHVWNTNTSVLPGNTWCVPMLSNIGFTDTGDLVLNFMDRSGHQHGNGTYKNLGSASNTTVPFYTVGGDILIAGKNCSNGSLTLESNGSCASQGGTLTSSGGVGNNEGPGGGEFFSGESHGGYHEGCVGALAKIPHRDEIIVTMMGNTGIVNNGTKHMSLINGSGFTNVHLAGGNPEYSKSNSLGDIELVGDCLPLHIGNRVWLDINADGIQDANEPGAAGVNLELFADFNADGNPDGAALASTATDAAGEFYFNDSNVPDSDPVTPGVQKGMSSHATYLLRIAATDWNGSVGLNAIAKGTPTAANAGSAMANSDIRDNDAELANGWPQIVVNTKMNGNNLFDLDFGFKVCPEINTTDENITCIKPSVVIGPSNNLAGSTFLWQPPTGLSSTNIQNPTASPSTTTVYTLTVDDVCQSTVLVTVDADIPEINIATADSITCNKNPDGVVIGTTYTEGYLYSWAPPQNLSNVDSATTTANPAQTTTYSLTVTDGAGGCTNTAAITVFVDKCCTRVAMANSFTPNFDGINDDYGPIELANLNVFTLRIFNRFGECVFETKNDKTNRWYGEYKGLTCEMGTYFYVLTYECGDGGQPNTITGDISLIR